jgi:uncharacterized protein (TIGR02246 family)
MRSLHRSLALGALVLLEAGCRPAGSPSRAAAAGPLAAEEVAAIRGIDSAFAAAAESGNAEAVAALYTTDARLMPPNEPVVKGREAIQKFWGGFLAAYSVKFEITADEVEGRGDLAYARGRYTMDGTPKAGGPPPFHDEGKYLEVLRRRADGSWQYAVDMYSSDLPAPR